MREVGERGGIRQTYIPLYILRFMHITSSKETILNKTYKEDQRVSSRRAGSYHNFYMDR